MGGIVWIMKEDFGVLDLWFYRKERSTALVGLVRVNAGINTVDSARVKRILRIEK